MTKQIKDKRAFFSAGVQKTFLIRVGEKVPTKEISRISHHSERAVRDWRAEKFSMPLSVVHALSKASGVPIPKNIDVRNAYEHTARAGKLGISSTTAKYGRIPRNENYRKEQWRLWWESTGKLAKNPILESKSVRKPKRSAELAEFIGIMMGDGGMSAYQIAITLHHKDDIEYLSFVTKLIEKLFRITPSIYHSPTKSVNNIVISRKELVHHLHELGLPIGNKVKQQFDIPRWIKEDQKLSKACIRGLVDTDGSIFNHKYRVKGAQYTYKKLSFTSASSPLLKSVHTILRDLDFNPRLTTKDVRLDSIADMKRYFSIIGSHNPKHLRRYESKVGY